MLMFKYLDLYTQIHRTCTHHFYSHKHAFLNIKALTFQSVLLIHACAWIHFIYTCSDSHSYMITGHTQTTTQPSKLILKSPQNPTPENTHSKQNPNQNTNTFWPYPIKIPPLKSKPKPKPKSPNTLTKKKKKKTERKRRRPPHLDMVVGGGASV